MPAMPVTSLASSLPRPFRQAAVLLALAGLQAMPVWASPAADTQEPAAAATSQAETAPPAFQLSQDGRFVLDMRARLAWPRCVEGMQWDGQHCQGLPDLLTYKQAQARAQEQSRTGDVRWRMPRVNEMRRLIDRSVRPQGLHPVLFPDAPRGWHWTGSAAVNARPSNPYNYSQISGQSPISQLAAQQAWAINLDTLETAPDMGRGNQLMVRLVRPMQDADLPRP